MPKKLLIGVTGTFGSGKSTASFHIENLGYQRVVMSSFLEEEARKRGIKRITRKLLQDIGNEWREKYGRGVLAKKTIDFIKKHKDGKFVVDGIRNIGEIEVFKKETEFHLVGVIADRDVRFQRLKKLKRREDLTPELFFKLDCRDLGLGQKKTGLQVAFCFALADYFIENNEDLEVFKSRLDNLIKKII
ncbi:MAG: AAA family ATPase [Candidatus Levyibacteriota bacterium]